MTSFAMIAGMVPMALGLGEGGDQTAPLGRAVIGGLVAATASTLLVLPAAFALVRGGAAPASVSLDPDDPDGRHFDGAPGGGGGSLEARPDGGWSLADWFHKRGP